LGVAILPGCKKKEPPPKPPPEVQFITLVSTNVPIFEEWIGTLDGFVNAQIHAQVTGYLLAQNYKEGAPVRKGDVLFQIDPRPFQATVDQAQAKLAQDKAQLGKAELDVKRYTPLAKEQAISQEQLDNAVQAMLAAQAQVSADAAAVTNAQLNLSFTQITSPVDGLAGIAQAQIGDLVGPSGNALTTISTISPIKAYFNVSELSYGGFWERFVGPEATNQDLSLQLILANGSAWPEKGRFFIADRQVNPNTGTLQIVGLFSNANFMLRPGQYGRVRAQTQTKQGAILVPQRAITELQGGYQVTIVDDQNTAHVRPVKVAEQIASDWIIEEGLKPGEHLIVEGLQQAKEGTVVNPKPFTRPNANNGSATNKLSGG
jgi:membrane fusion protein (multidrug efflux system)